MSRLLSSLVVLLLGVPLPLAAQSMSAAVLPKGFDTQFATAASVVPLGYVPCRYQQVFVGSELPGSLAIRGLGFRFDDLVQSAKGETVELEVTLAYTTRSPASLSGDFAKNLDVTTPAPVVVIPRSKMLLPDPPATPSTSPTHWQVQLAFQRPFAWSGASNHNLLVEIRIFGNSNNDQSFAYQLDTCTGGSASTTRVFASGPAAKTGGVSRNYGVVMKFLDRVKSSGSFAAYGVGCPGSGASRIVPSLSNTGRPVLGQSHTIDLSGARPLSAAVLIFGVSDQRWSSLALPLDLSPLGAPGCSVLASIDLLFPTATDAAGAASLKFALPGNTSLDGLTWFHQYFVVDSPANALGLAFSNAARLQIGAR